MNLFERAIAGDALLNQRQVERLMRSVPFRNLVAVAKATAPGKVPLHPAVHELLRGEKRHNPNDGVQLALPPEFLFQPN